MLGDLLSGLGEPHTITQGDLAVEITSLATDSRRVERGGLFFALPGARTDGRRFVDDAVGRGAVAVAAPEASEAPRGITFVRLPKIHRGMSEIAARFFGHPSAKLDLLGVTGTNGKTTTTYLLESIWRAAGFSPGVIGTIEYRVGTERWTAPFTTPQAIELQALLARMAGAGASHVVMEVSSHALALDRARDCQWDGALFTNLTRDHLDFHPDMESYFAAKASLFADSLSASPKPNRFAVVNRDDPYGQRLLPMIRERVVTFGRTDEADVAPVEVERSLSGLRGMLRVATERLEITSALVGEAHLDNVLAATAAAFARGIPLPAIEEGIRLCRGVPGRMERIDEGSPFAVLVDYAHTPDALERAVRALRSLAERRLIVVFGCGGDRDRGKRPLMGEAAARIADVVILTSDNPRSEDPLKILHEIERGILEAGLDPVSEPQVRRDQSASGYLVLPDRRRAIAFSIEIARPGDVVLIAGKGHEGYQIIGAERLEFDDRQEVRRCLGGARTS